MTDQDQFQCGQCTQTGDKATLASHFAVRHAGQEEVPFLCGACERRFVRKDPLKRHIRTYHPQAAWADLLKGTHRAYTLKKGEVTKIPTRQDSQGTAAANKASKKRKLGTNADAKRIGEMVAGLAPPQRISPLHTPPEGRKSRQRQAKVVADKRSRSNSGNSVVSFGSISTTVSGPSDTGSHKDSDTGSHQDSDTGSHQDSTPLIARSNRTVKSSSVATDEASTANAKASADARPSCSNMTAEEESQPMESEATPKAADEKSAGKKDKATTSKKQQPADNVKPAAAKTKLASREGKAPAGKDKAATTKKQQSASGNVKPASVKAKPASGEEKSAAGVTHDNPDKASPGKSGRYAETLTPTLQHLAVGVQELHQATTSLAVNMDTLQASNHRNLTEAIGRLGDIHLEQQQIRIQLTDLNVSMTNLTKHLGTLIERQSQPPPIQAPQPAQPAQPQSAHPSFRLPQSPILELDAPSLGTSSDKEDSGSESDSSTSTNTSKPTATPKPTAVPNAKECNNNEIIPSTEEAGAISPERGLNQQLARLGRRDSDPEEKGHRRSTSHSNSHDQQGQHHSRSDNTNTNRRSRTPEHRGRRDQRDHLEASREHREIYATYDHRDREYDRAAYAAYPQDYYRNEHYREHYRSHPEYRDAGYAARDPYYRRRR